MVEPDGHWHTPLTGSNVSSQTHDVLSDERINVLLQTEHVVSVAHVVQYLILQTG